MENKKTFKLPLNTVRINETVLEHILSQQPDGGGYKGCECSASWYQKWGAIYYQAYKEYVTGNPGAGVWQDPCETEQDEFETLSILKVDHEFMGTKGVVIAHRVGQLPNLPCDYRDQ